jgi:hypothetical protein
VATNSGPELRGPVLKQPGSPLEINQPQPLAAPRKNLSDTTWNNIVQSLDSAMIYRARAYDGPRTSSPELVAFIEELNAIFSDLPRNTPVTLRNRLENTYRDAVFLATGTRPNFKQPTKGGRNPQRRLPGTN